MDGVERCLIGRHMTGGANKVGRVETCEGMCVGIAGTSEIATNGLTKRMDGWLVGWMDRSVGQEWRCEGRVITDLAMIRNDGCREGGKLVEQRNIIEGTDRAGCGVSNRWKGGCNNNELITIV
jgi:hypothetical protein